jgi:hypothetical protein
MLKTGIFMTSWRFDQGRLDYFQFDEVKRIARALVAIDGIAKPKLKDDFLRKSLSAHSSRPFAPADYTVWRNYKRAFGCLMLATEVAGKIICTDLCKVLANASEQIDVDDYLGHVAKRFYYPSPVFEGYSHLGLQIFPIAAIIKLLLSEYLTKGKTHASIDEIGQYLIANKVTGLEPLDFYSKLELKPVSDDLRQTRELVRFISQFSFLKWNNPNLYLDVTSKSEAHQIEALLSPQIGNRNPDAGAELLNLGANFEGTALGDLTISQVNAIDTGFTEGNKIRGTHLRSERSAKLKEFYFSHVENPHICDMCSMDTAKKYPWVDRLVELHHLLPLSSPVRVTASATSTKDVVGLCPSCHRATHKYYSKWLNDKGASDFENHEEARHVYIETKRGIVLA